MIGPATPHPMMRTRGGDMKDFIEEELGDGRLQEFE